MCIVYVYHQGKEKKGVTMPRPKLDEATKKRRYNVMLSEQLHRRAMERVEQNRDKYYGGFSEYVRDLILEDLAHKLEIIK